MVTKRSHKPDERRPADELADDTGDLHFVPAPCQVGCPIGTDAPSYIALIWEGRLFFNDAATTETSPCARPIPARSRACSSVASSVM